MANVHRRYGASWTVLRTRVDSNDKLHIAYFDNGKFEPQIRNNSTGSWNDFTIDNTGSLGHYPSIDVDSNDAVHISYLAGLQNLKYATNAGGVWSRSVADQEEGEQPPRRVLFVNKARLK
ncbi:MAG: hypothetical protein Ct9H90mP16_10600 [Candidatus Poseidoniales archaeon]|nr:MAG: hypothetical protein Ct9H90mP16_10600 [Candidatus Poseidoniales archaeon]